MRNFCTNCGASLGSAAAFCYRCGASTTPGVNTTGQPSIQPVKKKRTGLKWFLSIVSVLLIITLGIICYNQFFNHPYAQAFETVASLAVSSSTSKIEDLAPQEYWSWAEDAQGMYSLGQAKVKYSSVLKENYDQCGKHYGSDYSIQFRYSQRQQIPEKGLTDIADALESKYDIKALRIKDAYKVKYEVVVQGSFDVFIHDSDSNWANVVRIDDSWYFFDYGFVPLVDSSGNREEVLDVWFTFTPFPVDKYAQYVGTQTNTDPWATYTD